MPLTTAGCVATVTPAKDGKADRSSPNVARVTKIPSSRLSADIDIELGENFSLGLNAISMPGTSLVLFGTTSFDTLSSGERTQLLASVPSSVIAASDLADGKLLIDLVAECDFVASKSEAKRLSDAKGLRLNGEPVAADRKLYAADLPGGLAIVQKGKTERLLVALK